MNFNFSKVERQEVLNTITTQLESIYNNPREELLVSNAIKRDEVTRSANTFSFNHTNDAKDVMLHVIESIKRHGVQVTHPSYLGLFNPRPNFPSIMADTINSYLNPQLAAWSHGAYAVEIEQLVIKEFGKKFGYNEGNLEGVFCVGGSESNQTAVLTALQKHFPSIAEKGLQSINKQPIIYGSSESHHSIEKAARSAGLGASAVKKIPVNDDLTMNVEALQIQIQEDINNGCHPFMVVGTAGTTGAGVFDDLDKIAEICKTFNLWLHADAAYGGGAIITNLKHYLNGIEKSDSITLDLHKWFSVPMATSIFLTSHTKILSKTFGVKTDYMPEDGDPNQVFDNYVNSLQWSRRFIGLKIYLPLAIFGWEGYTKMLTHQIEMGDELRNLLMDNGWIIENLSQLPILCFSHPDVEDALVQKIVDELNVSGKTWLSTYPINGKLTFRVQIANYDTQKEDLYTFVNLLREYTHKYMSINQV